MMRYVLISIMMLALLPVRAQGEMEVDWAAYAQDTVLPLFTHSIDLGYNHVGREYQAVIEYPELLPLTSEEIERYSLPKEGALPEWPDIDTYKGVIAKRGQLDISFIPIIWRDGKYQKITNFTLKVDSTSPAAYVRTASQEQRVVFHSRLSKGRWVKLRVEDNGVHMLTHARLRGMGFDNPGKVRLYGYGGHPLSESNTDSWIDDLCEVPLWRVDDRLLFYANGPVQWTLQNDNTFTHTHNPYSEYGYYFLTEDTEGEPATFPVREALDAVNPVVETTPAYALHEVDDYAWFHGGRQLVESYDYAGATRCMLQTFIH